MRLPIILEREAVECAYNSSRDAPSGIIESRVDRGTIHSLSLAHLKWE
jgi:hypothetical protein